MACSRLAAKALEAQSLALQMLKREPDVASRRGAQSPRSLAAVCLGGTVREYLDLTGRRRADGEMVQHGCARPNVSVLDEKMICGSLPPQGG